MPYVISGAPYRVLVIDPSDFDMRMMQRDALRDTYDIIPYHFGENAGGLLEFDIYAHLHTILQQYHGIIDGVLSTQDYAGNILAALVAEHCGLPGPSVSSVATCQHKYLSRCAQRASVPEATPQFDYVDPSNISASVASLSVGFPCFVKPAKAYFSFGAERITSSDNLRERLLYLLPARSFLRPLDDVLAAYQVGMHSDYLVAEEPLSGQQVNFEGYVRDNTVYTVGVTDAHMYPGTISFNQFVYPSALPHTVISRMCNIAQRVLTYIGLNESFFNIEFAYDATTDALHIIEINPRAAAQCADLYDKVDGMSSYDQMLALAVGLRIPRQRSQGQYAVAASFPYRMFHNHYVRKSPTSGMMQKAHKRFPDALIAIHGTTGTYLSDHLQDGDSFLYAIINIGGRDMNDLMSRGRTCKRMLPFQLEPCHA